MHQGTTLLFSSILAAVPAATVLGHGSMKQPVSRVYSIYLEGPESPDSAAAQAAVAECGTQPFYDWHELVNFFPGDAAYQQDVPYEKHIPDGRIASADNDKYSCLDMIRDDWPATPVQSGPNELVWYASTPHDPSVFRAWLTTPDWNPLDPLNWAQMEEIELGEVSLIGQEYRFETNFPEREGRHVLYVIWQRLDPVGEGFYAACDIVFGDDGGAPVGACCIDDGCSLASEATCLANGGDYQGDDVFCSDAGCGGGMQGPDSISIALVDAWNGGYQAEMTVTNSMGNEPMLHWDFSYESGPVISSIWSAVVEIVEGETIISNEAWNGYIDPGGSVSFGFVADGTWPPVFTDSELNGMHVHVEGAGDEHAPCLGDLDEDEAVGVNDLLILLAAWATADQHADLDEDGVVGVTDLLLVIGAWGPCD